MNYDLGFMISRGCSSRFGLHVLRDLGVLCARQRFLLSRRCVLWKVPHAKAAMYAKDYSGRPFAILLIPSFK